MIPFGNPQDIRKQFISDFKLSYMIKELKEALQHCYKHCNA